MAAAIFGSTGKRGIKLPCERAPPDPTEGPPLCVSESLSRSSPASGAYAGARSKAAAISERV